MEVDGKDPSYGSSLDVSWLAGFVAEHQTFFLGVALFTILYLLGYFVVFRSWKGEKRADASSCTMSLVHGVVTATLGGRELLLNPWQLDAPNTVMQDRIMEFSLAYFTVDAVHLCLLSFDVLFLIHHVFTSLYMLSTLAYVRHGALSVMSLVTAGEVTSPVQNTWTISRLGKDRHPAYDRLYKALSPFFTVYFTLMRAGVGPWLLWELTSFYIVGKADHIMPRWLAVVWVSIVFLAIVGSLVWVYQLWVGLIKFYSRRKQQKKVD